MQLWKRAAEAAAIALVAIAYVWFATAGTMRFGRAPDPPRGWDNPGGGYYAQQAEGFLRGQTHLAMVPDPRMATLADPYDYGQRDALRISYLWDASYYEGRYYLYFTPLPVVLFYVPYRWALGHHADDAAAAVFFSVWTFLAALFIVRRMRWRIVWILFAGLANLLPFALSNVRVYEVAILCATAFSTTWAAALLSFERRPSARAAAWMSLWLALAIAARPNLIVLLLPAIFILLRHGRRVLIAAAVPLVVVACAYLGYNYARFGQPLESGITYQLTYVPMRGLSRCGVCNEAEVVRFVSNALQYQFTPPVLTAKFPHLTAPIAHIDKSVSWPGGEPEEIIGIIPLVPLTVTATLFALLLALRRRARAATSILGGAWLVLFALSTCWWIVSRYSFDFQILMLVGTALCVEEGLALLAEWPVPTTPLRAIAVALAIYSVVIATLLGFEGREGAFRKRTGNYASARVITTAASPSG